MSLPSLQDLLAAGAHFGHKASHWHPKMKPFIFMERSGLHIIHLEETQKHLQRALDQVRELAARGGTLLFVGTKPQAKAAIKAAAESCGMPSVTNRWLGGTLTNFDVIKKLIKKYRSLLDQQAKGELRKYTKQEQIWIARDIEDLEQKIGGISQLERLPDMIFLADIRQDKTAMLEALSVSVPLAAICDTNVNPDQITFPIPANDDAVKTISLIAHLLAEAVNEGKAKAQAERAAVEKTPAPAPAPALS